MGSYGKLHIDVIYFIRFAVCNNDKIIYFVYVVQETICALVNAVTHSKVSLISKTVPGIN
jgi:hypothetical protein